MLAAKATVFNRLPRFLRDVPSLKFLDISLGSSAEMENFEIDHSLLNSSAFTEKFYIETNA